MRNRISEDRLNRPTNTLFSDISAFGNFAEHESQAYIKPESISIVNRSRTRAPSPKRNCCDSTICQCYLQCVNDS